MSINFDNIKTNVFVKKAKLDLTKDKARFLSQPRYDFYTWGCNDEKKCQDQTVLIEERIGVLNRDFLSAKKIETKRYVAPTGAKLQNDIIFEKYIQKTRNDYNDIIILRWTFFDGRMQTKKLGKLRQDTKIPSIFSVRIDAKDYPNFDTKSFQNMVLNDISETLVNRQTGFDFAKQYPVIWNKQVDKKVYEIENGKFFEPPKYVNRQKILKPIEKNDKMSFY